MIAGVMAFAARHNEFPGPVALPAGLIPKVIINDLWCKERRYEIFGKDALALKHRRLALSSVEGRGTALRPAREQAAQ